MSWLAIPSRTVDAMGARLPRAGEGAAGAPAEVPGALGRHAVLIGWIIAGVLMVAPLGYAPTERTQEGRVLETAREMLDARSFRDVIVPRMNGELRLKKPPLAYWLAAGSFLVFGVNEFAGRLPFALASWLTAAVVYRMGRRLWGPGAGFFAGAALLGTTMVARYGRLAETDALVMLFTSIAVYAKWRGLEPELFRRHRNPDEKDWSPAAWFNVGAVAIAMTALAKGLPAAYPLLVMLAQVAVRRRWDRLRAWATSGAPLVALAIAAPWFAYITATLDGETLANEVRVVAVGGGHRGSVFDYLIVLPLTVVPWVGFTGLALWMAVKRRRAWRDPRVFGIVAWAGIIMLALSFAGQKQRHYLVPLMPPLALLTGWAVTRVLRSRPAGSKLRGTGEAILSVTIAAAGACAAGAVLAGRMQGGGVRLVDCVTALVLAASAMVVWRGRRAAASDAPGGGLPAGLAATAGASVVALAVVVGWWLPSLHRGDARTVAASLIGAFGDRPMVYYGSGTPCLAFEARRPIPVILDEPHLRDVIRAAPSTVVLIETRPARPPHPVPPMLAEQLAVSWDELVLRAYVPTERAATGEQR